MEAKHITPENAHYKDGEMLKGVFDATVSKLTSFSKSNMARKLTGIPSSIKNGFTDNVVRKTKETKEYLNSVKEKNARMKCLELLLKVDGDQIVSSNKKNIIYRSGTGKLTIVDKDFWGEPVSVTTKDENSVSIMKVKFSTESLFLYPAYDERSLKGEVFLLDQNEIWYKDEDAITVLLFKSDKYETLKFKLPKRLSSREEIIDYISINIKIHKDKRISSLLKDKGIQLEKVSKIGQNYILVSDDSNGYTSYYSDENGEYSGTVILGKLPKLDDSGLESLFSYEICNHSIKSGYKLEDFIQNGDFIEYWQTVGTKKVCVMRFKR